ncbi:hypothetical protein [Pararhizobium sp. PWRC1-1]|uniref:hypothetical protein n=1 Tax=Pararhizobium sp. PWRC1-1 TaxID=2804566 RepID=UPI003CF2B6CB
MNTKGIRYLLTRIENSEVTVGSLPQTVDDIKLVLAENDIPVEEGLAHLHQFGALKLSQSAGDGSVEIILQAKQVH